jgi:hypothetical protein
MAIQRKWLVIYYTAGGDSGRAQYNWFRTNRSASRFYRDARAAGYYACFPVWKP